MKNHIKAVLIGFFILLVAGALGFLVFSRKKTINIQNSVVSVQQTEDSGQQTADSNQNTEEKSNSNQQPVISNQEKESALIKEKAKPTTNNEPRTTNNPKIIDKFISWGFEKSSGRKIDTIIIHSSYDALGDEPYDVDGLLAEYKQYGVSAHYLISRDGKIYHLVEDKNIAYHAGTSKMPDGRTGVNTFSIGIEIMNKEDGKFTDAEYSSLNSLVSDLKKQYSIKYVLGHDDIAPGRKTDPWGMEWDKIDK